jgi:hypothetical protein
VLGALVELMIDQFLIVGQKWAYPYDEGPPLRFRKSHCLRPILAEGDGWVNWSGLATLMVDVAHAISAPLHRLLG